MARVFNATAGAAAATSFCTTDEADEYLQTARLHVGTEWTGLKEEEKQAVLMWATRQIDRFNFIGDVATSEQALQWPRINAYRTDGRYVDETEVPQAIKDATSELALWLGEQDRTAAPDGEQYESVTVGPISVTYRDQNSGDDIVNTMPDEVTAIMSRYLEGGFGLNRKVIRR